jgi:molecular chaperone GrpE
MVEELLPVLDNFERAIAHGEGGEGVQLVFKDLRAAMERAGLEEVPVEGVSFDPNIHEAVESRAVEGVTEATIIEVYRRGYMLKDRLIRPAMVVVGRPLEQNDR